MTDREDLADADALPDMMAEAARRGALPLAPLAMPVQRLDSDLRGLLPRLFASLAPRIGG